MKRSRSIPAAAVLAIAAVGGAVIGVASVPRQPAPASPSIAGEPLSDCRVTDGDTIRCGSERIRLLGIDAPELPGHCRPGRDCAPGDPVVSASSLASAMRGILRISRVGTDHYGRTLALVSGAGGDLSCYQLAHRQAIYKPQWDDGGKLAAICPQT